MAPVERLKILMQVQGNEKVYTNMWQVRVGFKRLRFSQKRLAQGYCTCQVSKHHIYVLWQARLPFFAIVSRVLTS